MEKTTEPSDDGTIQGFPGRHVARAHTANHHSGAWLPGTLVAGTLKALVAMMPSRLRRPRAAIDPPGMGGDVGLSASYFLLQR